MLRPGGRLALAVWGPPERNPYFSAVAIPLVQGGHMPAPDPEGPGPFSMASTERMMELLGSAGFGEVRAEEVAVSFELTDIDRYLEFVADTAGPIAMVLRGLSPADRDAVTVQAEAALEASPARAATRSQASPSAAWQAEHEGKSRSGSVRDRAVSRGVRVRL